jgi:mannose-1-phosphate guanylyltransferase
LTNTLDLCRRIEMPYQVDTTPDRAMQPHIHHQNASFVSNRRRAWAVLLAGGDGTRLQSLTHKIAGDSRPKQFCRIFGDKSLLNQTLERVSPLFPSGRTMFVVTKSHEAFYREDLANAGDSHIIEQPRNRGTGVAIASALLRILQSDADPVVAFFPCDHYYSNDDAFRLAVGSAMAFAGEHPASVVLLGAEARHAEVEYGWIEPGRAILDEPAVPLFRVSRFWEKPSLPEAEVLLRRGCLWNTFVTVGRAEAFLDLLCSEIPDVVLSIASALSANTESAGGGLDSAYREVPAVDFSRQVLAPQFHRLLVVRDATSGWADLGNPTRVIDTLVQNSIEPAWLSAMR